jgi:hypothetical protein
MVKRCVPAATDADPGFRRSGRGIGVAVFGVPESDALVVAASESEKAADHEV